MGGELRTSVSVRTALLRRCPGDGHRGPRLRGGAAGPDRPAGRASGLSGDELVEPRHQQGAARSGLGGLHRFRQRPRPRPIRPRRPACTTTSARRRTASRMSSSPAISRSCGRPGPTTATRATKGRPAGRSATRFRTRPRRRPNYIEGGVPGGGSSGDRHMLIVDKDNWLLYETAVTRWHAASNSWRADCGAIFDLRRSDRRPDRWTSADAAGLAIFPGLVRYEEVYGAAGDHARLPRHRAIDQRLRVARVPCAGSTSGALPMGARLRMKAVEESLRLPAGDAARLPRHEALRPHRRRQRHRHVRQRDDGSAVEQRRAEPRLPCA